VSLLRHVAGGPRQEGPTGRSYNLGGVPRRPEADDRTRAAADSRSRALLHKVKGNAAFTEGEFSDAMDLWEEALGELGVAYLEVGGGGYYVVGKNLD
jgi:hypothetical protein